MTDTSTADTTVTDTRGVPLCELRDIKVAFGGLHAVDGVTVDLYPGEVIGLVGGNGAGSMARPWSSTTRATPATTA